MKAVIITDQIEPLQLTDIPKPSIENGECLVKVMAAGLNRRDQWIREGMYPGIRHGCILGSDVYGVVEAGSSEWIGKEVIVNPNVDWGSNPQFQSPKYSVLGMPENGGLAEYIKVPADRLHLKPIHLSTEEAAGLPLGALTAFRATIKKGEASTSKKVLITGAGGGVAQFAIAFSLAAGAETYVTSGSKEKIAACEQMGVKKGFNYKDEKWFKEASEVGGFDTIVDSAGGNQLNNYLKVVKPGGKIVMYGSTIGYPEKLDVFKLFWSQAQIMGSTMGSDEEFAEMIQFVSDHKIKPTIDQVYDLDNYLEAFDRFKAPDHFGNIIIKMP